jgi:hypothetical protein
MVRDNHDQGKKGNRHLDKDQQAERVMEDCPIISL